MRAIDISLFLAAPALVSAATASLRKRISGYATFYYTQTGNAGSCGSYLSDSGFTVAMNQVQYTDSMCGQTITITANGQTTQATIMDLCPTGGGNCNYGDMDMSPSLFQFFASLDAGKIPIQWDFGGNASPPPQQTTTQDQDTYTPPPPETTSYDQPAPDTTTTSWTPDTTWQPPTTTPTSSSTSPSSTSTSTSSSTSTSTSSSTSSYRTSSSSSAPATSPSAHLTAQNQDQSPMRGNLSGMSEAVVSIGNMVRYAGGNGA